MSDPKTLLALCHKHPKAITGDQWARIKNELQDRLEAEMRAPEASAENPGTIVVCAKCMVPQFYNGSQADNWANCYACNGISGDESHHLARPVTLTMALTPEVIEAVRLVLVNEIGGRAPRAANESSLDYTRRVATLAATTLVEQLAVRPVTPTPTKEQIAANFDLPAPLRLMASALEYLEPSDMVTIETRLEAIAVDVAGTMINRRLKIAISASDLKAALLTGATTSPLTCRATGDEE